ncbi:MAG: hypothetical protein A2Z32_03870 [Chloroflexi bacterium RBG_16_69_14]|nr:MAG: hypothetical protein A2Z32_03870 [Chloroflexi bacterium RBG_16_69_14]
MADGPGVESAGRGPDRALGALGPFVARQFGAVATDLGVDLSEPIGPAVITDILARCLSDGAGTPAPSEVVWNAPVGDRIAALVGIAAPEVGGSFSVPLRCADRDCREPIEIELTWAELRAVAERSAREPFKVDSDDAGFLVRRPTGTDQDRWRRFGLDAPDDPGALPAVGPEAGMDRVIVGDLIVEGPRERLTGADVATIQAALDEHDPLICCELAVLCPTCGTTSPVELSLTAVAIDVLRRVQGRIVDEIHDLARAYGWTEDTILAIPAWRRARYRAMTAADG